MHVNPFWFGVVCTVLVEVIACIIYAVINTKNKK